MLAVPSNMHFHVLALPVFMLAVSSSLAQ